jgi:hypothetical protein
MPGGGVSGSGIEADETPYDQPHARAGAATVEAIVGTRHGNNG